MKTIGFAGCSFTYGDGLEYYDGTNTLSRFSTLVGNHFNVNTVNQSFRGGSHTKIISWWEDYLKNNSVDVFVFQTTRWPRSDSKILPNVSYIEMMNRHHARLEGWLIENNLTLEEYLSQGKLDDTLSVLQFLQSYEDKFPIYILQWPEETLEIVKSSPWAQQRLISLTYKDKVFESISDLMGNPLNAKMLPISRIKKSAQTILFNTGEIFDFTDSSRPELTIATDYETFKKPRRDYHPSKLCHKVISDNIIWRLENDNIF